MKFSTKHKNILKEVYYFAKNKKVKLYLVGGVLRDMVLGREKQNPDFDFAIKRGAINFGRSLAKEMRAGFVVLDKEHGACRIVKKLEGKFCTLDFTDFRGKDLEDDLLHRDFTINSLALELEKVFSGGDLNNSLIDLYGARIDLKKKAVKAIGKKSFSEDPLRILRAFSFASILGFKIEKETLKLAKLERDKISGTSGERIRDELFKIFDSQNTFSFLDALDKLKILEIIFPEIKKMRGIGKGAYHHLDVWQHTLETVRQLEIIIDEHKKNEEVQNYLNEIISSERRRFALIKLGAFLHDIGKPKAMRRLKKKIIFHGHERIGLGLTEDIAKRLKLSNDEINSLRLMVLCHLRPGYLADTAAPTARAKFRFFRDCRHEAVSTLLISLADQRATKGPLTTKASRVQHEKVVSGLIREHYRKKKNKKAPRFLNGNDIMKQFKLEPSKLIGEILSEIEELQAIGKVKGRPDAFKAAGVFIKSKQK